VAHGRGMADSQLGGLIAGGMATPGAFISRRGGALEARLSHKGRRHSRSHSDQHNHCNMYTLCHYSEL
jgi:hypothetical protein